VTARVHTPRAVAGRRADGVNVLHLPAGLRLEIAGEQRPRLAAGLPAVPR
jgi:hypothetical protein